jgi:hypothetical protein
MDRERAELYLRLLAEEELRRARPGLRNTAAQGRGPRGAAASVAGR